MPTEAINEASYQRNKAIALRYVADFHRLRERETCEASLREFVKAAWRVVEPGVQYVHGWHIDAICKHLEAFDAGDIRKLIINIPPRSGKSTLISVIFPAWVWINHPERKWVYSSYGLFLSKRDTKACRGLLGSTWYQKHWASKFRIETGKGGTDNNQRFDNDRGGYRIATATDVGTTGEGGDRIVYDDPNNIKKMQSEAYIEEVIHFHEQVMGSRLNDQKTGGRLLVQQRCSERDLTGHILSKELGWEHLVIPMEFEERRPATSIGWEDPRHTPGALMWPEQLPPTELKELKAVLGPVGVAGQLQQRPSPGEGAKFKREWWNFYNAPGTEPKDADGKPIPVRIKSPGGEVVEKTPIACPVAFEQVVQGWDMAFKAESDSDFVAGHAWGRVGANAFLLARDSARMDFPQTLAAVRRMSVPFPCPEKMVEDKANGPAIIQTLKNEIPGLIESGIEGGLIALATSLTGYAEAGNIYLPNPNQFSWVWDLIEQFAVFPRGRNDDDVSAASHALRRIFDSAATCALPEFRVMPRLGEPETASHVKKDAEIMAELAPHWRRWIAVSPGTPGCAIWLAETPRGSLRVYRELSLEGFDAAEAGRRIAEASIPDAHAYLTTVHSAARWNIDLLMEKEAFVPIEPIGCYAELLEQGALNYESGAGSWEVREQVKRELSAAKFSSHMVAIEDASFDRLRDLLRFAPPDFEELDYDRAKAIKLSLQDIGDYKRYMAAVEGKVEGEYPRIKLAASCVRVIAALGAIRRDADITDSFLRALLVGISAPPLVNQLKAPKEVPLHELQQRHATMRLMRRRRAG